MIDAALSKYAVLPCFIHMLHCQFVWCMQECHISGPESKIVEVLPFHSSICCSVFWCEKHFQHLMELVVVKHLERYTSYYKGIFLQLTLI